MEVWKDRDGNTVPAKYVPQMDKKKTRLANKYAKQAKALKQKIIDFKLALIKDADALYKEQLDDANVRSGEKGNYSHNSFDGKISISMNIHNTIGFDDVNIKIAYTKLQEFIELKSIDSDPELVVFANEAFKSRKGQLDTKKVLSLKTYNIKHKLWMEMLKYIDKGIEIRNSKRYPQIKVANDEGKMEAVDLNFSSL